jgi:hypothetical protein
VDVFRLDSVAKAPWKNGGGTTRSLAVWPAGAGNGAEDWRVALSDIDKPGPFSDYSGYDRLLLPMAAGLRLGFDGAAPAPVPIFECIAFDGGAPTVAALDPASTAAPLQVVNVLLRRGTSTARLLPFPGSGRLHAPGGTIVLFTARGGFNVVVDAGRPQPLDAGSAAVIGDGRPVAFEPRRPWSLLVAAEIMPALT